MLSGPPIQRSEFIVDEDTDDLCEDIELWDQEEDLFDTCCSLCDNGGDILFCEGRCMRSFHVRRQTGDLGEEICEGLGLSQAQVKSMPHFFCENCQYQQHQCFICGKLGSSDITSKTEVFPCIAGNCGRFYHRTCVFKELQQRSEVQIENLENRIAAEESFVCPAHKCYSCKQVENRTVPEMQFAVCRRCPKSYHRKCLPREIIFATEDVTDVLPRAWDGLLPKRILMYCMNHEIDPNLGTPLRNHICFPRRVKEKVPTSEKTFTRVNVGHKKRTVDHSSMTNASAAQQKKLPKPSTSSTVYPRDPIMRRSEEKALLSAKPLTKKQGHSSPVDFEMERRMTALIEEVDSSFDVDEFLKQQKLTSMYNCNLKDMIDKHLTKGKVDAAVKAIREASQILDNGGSVEDAKAVCSVDLLRQLPLWKNKLKQYIYPFLHGMHFSSYGRHFTKTEKLQEIVNRLHNYVLDGDMIVDFCCGANEFSCLMKEKLDSVGKRCSYKNFDLFPTKNDFNFERRDWFTVDPKELPPGSKLVMGLNPPFGYKATLANKFINKALQFRPKLLILIVPPETKRLDSWNRRHPRYDLLWEDQHLLVGKSFYFPGAFNMQEENISQWNNTPPPLYLWSHPDWTRKHRDIMSKPLREEQDVQGDFMNVYDNLANVVHVEDVYGNQLGNVYSRDMSNVYQMSNVYGHRTNDVYSHHTSNVYSHHTSNVYNQSGPSFDHYSTAHSVENCGQIVVVRHVGRNGMDANLTGRENIASFCVEDDLQNMDISPTGTPR